MNKIFKGLFFVALSAVIFSACKKDNDDDPTNNDLENLSADANNDGKINILVLGSSSKLSDGSSAFESTQIAKELDSILSKDASHGLTVNVVSEDIYADKIVSTAIGQGGSSYNLTYYRHSLVQYYYWPENQATRWTNLKGEGSYDWDYVVIAPDPYVIAKTPGYFALGVNKIADKVAEGGGKTLLLMPWSSDATIAHFAEFTHRVADNATSSVTAINSGKAWEALANDKKDVASTFPTPNGAYLAAASIYSRLFEKSASNSSYTYDDEIAQTAQNAYEDSKTATYYSGSHSFVSPFNPCNITDSEINYNHTGTSSENGILSGLNYVFGKADETLVNEGTSPIEFNYGRANTNFEANKRYQIDNTKFQFSFGFPMQDDGSTGNTSMLYGLDARSGGVTNDTDLGVAEYMISNSETPYGRAIPIRTLYAQLAEAISGQSAYSDSWHMHGNLDKASASYMYTMLTGKCAAGSEPADNTSNEWKYWKSMMIGHQTAHTVMTMEGTFNGCN